MLKRVPNGSAPVPTGTIAADTPAAGVKAKVRIAFARFWSEATARELIDTILPDLKPFFDFEVSDEPRVVLYGPYGGAMPAGRYVKVFIGCENVRPIMSECDFAFGVLHEDYMRHPRYMRFARWGDDSQLIRKDKDWDAVLRSKTRFCAFLYAQHYPYREAFFRALSRYKPIDAPGRSMNNMPGIDSVPGQIDWKAKVAFLRDYKFVIAFENAAAPGYNTEKLSHAIEADCLPIYWGDPEIGRSFNVKRFVNGNDFVPRPRRFLPRLPYAPHSLKHKPELTLFPRIARKLNGIAGKVEQRTWALPGFAALVDQVIALDNDDELYLKHLREPFFNDNRPPDRSAWIARWRKIFEHASACHRREGAA
jgi:alpha(1,3/1,4) fucosyltransferase